jgi:hypothetical protein
VALVASLFAALLSIAQRRLSTPVRLVRRRARTISGSLELDDGSTVQVDQELLTRGSEEALRALTAATIALALALVLLRI